MNTINTIFRRLFPGVKASLSAKTALVARVIGPLERNLSISNDELQRLWNDADYGWSSFASALHFAVDRNGSFSKVRKADRNVSLSDGTFGHGPYVYITARIGVFKYDDDMSYTTHTVCIDGVQTLRVVVRAEKVSWSLVKASKDWTFKTRDQITELPDYLELPPPIRVVFDALWSTFMEVKRGQSVEWENPPPDHPVSKLRSL